MTKKRTLLSGALAAGLGIVLYVLFGTGSPPTNTPQLVADTADSPKAEIGNSPEVIDWNFRESRVDAMPPNPVVAVIKVDFPNGRSVDVALRQYSPQRPVYAVDGQPLAVHYDALAQAARLGDGAAARHLYRQLRICQNSFLDEKSLETGLAELRRTGELIYPNGRHEHLSDLNYSAELEDIVRDRFQNCKGLRVAQLENIESWLELGVKARDFLAMQDRTLIVGIDSEEGFDLIEDTWEMGHYGAASGLAILYKNGIPPQLNGTPDFVSSYAYTLIVRQLLLSADDNLGERSAKPPMRDANRLYAIDQVLGEKAGYMNKEQVEAAEDLAANLLLENKECCLGYWVRGQ